MYRLATRLRTHLHSRTRGQSLVEFALILPVFFTLTAAAIDLGRVYYSSITVNDAAREGVLEAAKNPGSYIANTDCTAANKLDNRVMCRTLNEARGGFVTVSPADVALSCTLVTPGPCPPATPVFGDTISVKVTGRFTLVTPLIGSFFGGQTITFSSTASAQLNVAPVNPPPAAPVANFTTTPTPPVGPAPLSIAFTDTSTGGPTTWTWDFGDGRGSTTQSPTHTYGSQGSYTAVLTATNAGGSTTYSQLIVVSAAIPAPPVADFTADQWSGPAPLPVTFTDTSTGVPASWAWDFGDGQSSIVQNPPTHSYSNIGNFYVKLTVTNAGGSNSITKMVTTNLVCQLPVASFSVSPSSGKKKQDPFTVTDTSTNMSTAGCNNTWSWNWGDGTGNSSLQAPPAHIYQSQGTFTIQLTVSNTAGTRSASHTVTVTP
jgi:PKD repeat protein